MMKLFELSNESEISEWAYKECLKGNDNKEIRKLITHSYWAYAYCKFIKDRDDMWRKIKSPKVAFWYNSEVKYRPELRIYRV